MCRRACLLSVGLGDLRSPSDGYRRPMIGAGSRGWALIRIAGAVAAFGVAAFLATVPPAGWEVALFRRINGWPETAAVLWWPIMQLGSLGGAMILAAAVAVVWKRRTGWLLAAATGSAWLVTQALKLAAGRSRPADLGIETLIRGAQPTGEGFPSGHAAVAFAAAIVLVGELAGRRRLVPIVVATFVAVARIYVGAHFPLDIVGGAATGVVVGLVFWHSGSSLAVKTGESS